MTLKMFKCIKCPKAKGQIKIKKQRLIRLALCYELTECFPTWLPIELVAEKKQPRITIGADPEFEVIGPGERVLRAENVLETNLLDAEIGADGTGSQLELRPEPSESITEFVEKVGELINEAPAMRAVDTVYPCGGHIHFGGGAIIENTSRIDRELRLAGLFSLLEGRARKDSSYNAWEQSYRDQDWGMEYRQPPATIFLTPETLRLFTKMIIRRVKRALGEEEPWEKSERKRLSEIIRVLARHIVPSAEYLNTVQAFWSESGPTLQSVANGGDFSPSELKQLQSLVGTKSPFKRITIIKDEKEEFNGALIRIKEVNLEKLTRYLKRLAELKEE